MTYYKFPKPREPQVFPLNRLVTDSDGEVLAHYVQGLPASEPEYFFSTALDELQKEGAINFYMFQYEFIESSGVPGEVTVDFLVFTRPQPTPVEIDGPFHDAEEDAIRDARINEAALRKQFNEVVHIDALLLTDETSALAAAREYF